MASGFVTMVATRVEGADMTEFGRYEEEVTRRLCERSRLLHIQYLDEVKPFVDMKVELHQRFGMCHFEMAAGKWEPVFDLGEATDLDEHLDLCIADIKERFERKMMREIFRYPTVPTWTWI